MLARLLVVRWYVATRPQAAAGLRIAAMFIRPLFRLVPDNTRIQFMRGRFLGLIVSAVLSTASVVLFFYPGLNLGIDFSGGIVMEVRTAGAGRFRADPRGAGRASISPSRACSASATPTEVLIRLDAQPTEAATQAGGDQGARGAGARRCRAPRSLRTDAVGASRLGRAVPQRPAGAGHQPADDPGLYLVPLRMAVRGRRGGDAAAGRHQGDRLPGADPHRVRPGDGRRRS